MVSSELQPAPHESLDRLAGAWWIFQLRRGHRYSTDDVLLAWAARRACPSAARVLELGAGVGSVGMLVLAGLAPTSRLISVEVQEISVGLARRSARLNGLTERVDQRHGDLRDPHVLDTIAPCDLVLANPPYLTPGKGVLSPHPQRAAARFELHGDITDFCRTAAQHLAPEGRFCFSHAAADLRLDPAISAAGLTLLTRQDVVFRSDQPPMITLRTCGWAGSTRVLPPLVVRGADGAWTAPYRAIRQELEIDP